ncbi:hypothetical protein LCGC14_0297860 [marine sediment metagenome]|uniref:VWFA domain-containing protein n=1 Tax=marine sediment metagenome TaxID=412755 RepID=A0A0F9U863_9ZZZZ
MNKDLTDITLVVDRSGSMQSCLTEAQGGINAFISEQKEVPGEALLTILEFDTAYDFVCSGTPIKDTPEYKLVPRGMTALLDAVGRAINETGERLGRMDDESRPGLVVIAIITDGHENASHEFTKQQVKVMVDRQTNDYQWKFVFLGADAGAFDEAASIGIHAGSTVMYAPDKSDKVYAATSANVSMARCDMAAGRTVCMDWSDEQRAEVK